eukprot:SAG11_NODE_24732_length_368_cov_56.535316_1_plen_87_part_00
MNIIDLNDDIMSKIKHNLFLKSLMKHRDKFMVMVNEFGVFDWYCWELERDLTGFYFDSYISYLNNNFNYSFVDVRGNCVLHRCNKA